MEKMFTLKGSRLPAADVKNIIFFVRPRLELMDIIAENVLRYLSQLMFGPKAVSPSHGFNVLTLMGVPHLVSSEKGGHLENRAGRKEPKRANGKLVKLFKQLEKGIKI